MAGYWFVRSGNRDDNIWDIVEEQSLITIGWNQVGDLSGLTYDQMVEGCREFYDPVWAGRDANMLYRFAHEIEDGDVVLTALPPERMLLIGRVTGDYVYTAPPDHHAADNLRQLVHTRRVEWLRTDISFDTCRRHGIPFGRITLWDASRYGEVIEALLDSDEDDDEDDIELYDGEMQFRLERDLQAAIRENITQLEDGLAITDGGTEQTVGAGRIDITAEDASGRTVVIELKAGTAQPDSVAQLLAYMGTIPNPEGRDIRGILVASDFHQRVRDAVHALPNVALKAYSFRFTFKDG